MTDMNSLGLPTKWTLEDALELIRALQPQCRKWNFHLALGGGVLNRGFSEKDLDLYFLPMGGGKPPDSDGLLKWLEMWGSPRLIGDGEYPDEPPYTHRQWYMYGKQRIDVFVLGAEAAVDKPEEALEGDAGERERPEPVVWHEWGAGPTAPTAGPTTNPRPRPGQVRTVNLDEDYWTVPLTNAINTAPTVDQTVHTPTRQVWYDPTRQVWYDNAGNLRTTED